VETKDPCSSGGDGGKEPAVLLVRDTWAKKGEKGRNPAAQVSPKRRGYHNSEQRKKNFLKWGRSTCPLQGKGRPELSDKGLRKKKCASSGGGKSWRQPPVGKRGPQFKRPCEHQTGKKGGVSDPATRTRGGGKRRKKKIEIEPSTAFPKRGEKRGEVGIGPKGSGKFLVFLGEKGNDDLWRTTRTAEGEYRKPDRTPRKREERPTRPEKKKGGGKKKLPCLSQIGDQQSRGGGECPRSWDGGHYNISFGKGRLFLGEKKIGFSRKARKKTRIARITE